MNSLKDFFSSDIRHVFTDIDGTLTTGDKLSAATYQSLWSLFQSGVHVIPVTGRPAGWCEMIARQWPVHGVIGENGAFYFRHVQNKMHRHFFAAPKEREKFSLKLKQIEKEVLKEVPRARVASDQFSRLFDLAIDFAEDVKPALSKKDIEKIAAVFESHGATCKVSHIHVNGWFGNQNKGDACFYYAKEELGLKTENEIQKTCAYVGDSPNDEPLFEKFQNSFGVANVIDYKEFMKELPKYVASAREGEGFVEIARRLLQS
jgi:HAD superfamily hydrolase (TIGR01484 family)